MQLNYLALVYILCIAGAAAHDGEIVAVSPAQESLRYRGLNSNIEEAPLNIAIATTVSMNFHNVFYAWLSLLMYTSGLSEHNISIFAGCLDAKNDDANTGPKKGSVLELVPNGLECSSISYIPGFAEKSRLHVSQHISPIPNIRRVLMLQAIASTKEYDMLIYADSDAFFIRNPIPELVGLKLHPEQYSLMLSSIGGDAMGGYCNGFMVVADMDILSDWVHLGVYSQLNVNSWLRNRTEESKSNDVNIAGVTTVTKVRIPEKETDETEATKEPWKVYRLPHPRYFRGVCQNYYNNTLVYHCVSHYYNAEKKKTKLGKRIFTQEQVKQSTRAMSGALTQGSAKEVRVQNFKTDRMDPANKKQDGKPWPVEMHVTLRPAIIVNANMHSFRNRMLELTWFNELLKQYKV